jgi:DNA primase
VVQAEQIKCFVSPTQVLNLYNVEKASTGLYKCCWHTDKTASMKVFSRYVYCHGCGAKGSVIDLYMRLTGSNFYDSCNELGSLFRLSDDKKSIANANKAREERRKQQEIETAKKARKIEAFCLLCDLEKKYKKQIAEAIDKNALLSARLRHVSDKLDWMMGFDK